MMSWLSKKRITNIVGWLIFICLILLLTLHAHKGQVEAENRHKAIIYRKCVDGYVFVVAETGRYDGGISITQMFGVNSQPISCR